MIIRVFCVHTATCLNTNNEIIALKHSNHSKMHANYKSHKPSQATPSRLPMETTIFFSTLANIRRVVVVMSVARDRMLTTVPIFPQIPGPTQRYNRFSLVDNIHFHYICINVDE